MHPFELILHFSILALASTYTAAAPDTQDLREVGLNKRIRELVGKRAGPDDDYRNFDKRIREMIGKRAMSDENMQEKRIRELIGKRDMSDGFEPSIKRIRELVGKRDYVSGGEDVFNKDKRIRELVGKREIGLDQNDMIDKRIRELIGKRSRNVGFSKRVREMIG